MKAKQFLLLSLLTPLIVPLLLIGIINFPAKITNVITPILLLNQPISLILGVLVMSLFFAGIPFTLLVISIAIWSRRRSTKQLYKKIILMPLYLLPLEFLYFCMFYIFWDHNIYKLTVTAFISAFLASATAIIFLAPFTILVGYTYIGIIYCLYGLLIKKGILRRDDIKLPYPEKVQ